MQQDACNKNNCRNQHDAASAQQLQIQKVQLHLERPHAATYTQKAETSSSCLTLDIFGIRLLVLGDVLAKESLMTDQSLTLVACETTTAGVGGTW
jgi:hypothetical protein